MILKVPTYTVNKGLNDKETVFCAFMLFLSRAEGKKYRYHFYSEDIKYMLSHIKRKASVLAVQEYGLNSIDERMGKLRKLFDISVLNYHTWGVSFPNMQDEYISRNGWIKYSEVVITDPFAIKVWCYLVGRASNGPIATDYNGQLYDKDSRKDKALHPFFHNDFNML